MKLNKAEKVETNLFEMEFAVDADTIKEAISTVYKRDAKKYNVPGFRKGKAPRNLIEKMYGADIFLYDAIEEVFPKEYEAAVKETEIVPVDQPEVELVSASVTDGVVLKVKVVTKPEMKLGNYVGLKATKVVEEIDDEKVNEELERLQKRNARMIPREGAAQNGDQVKIDFEGFMNDVPFDGGRGEQHPLRLGSGQFIPGFEDQIVGHNVGDEFDVNVTFPKEYHAEALAGNDAVFKVKLHDIQVEELPELDDEFAKDVSEFDTLDELKENIRKDLGKAQDERAEMEMEDQLVNQVVESMEGEIPEIMYEHRIDEALRDFTFRLEQQGLNLKDYCRYAGMTEEEMRNGFREQAEKQVKIRLALETIVKLENIVATEEDIEAEVARVAEKYGMEAGQIRNLMPAEEIAKDLAVNKAIDLIKSKAEVTVEKAKKQEEKAEEAAE